MAEMPASVYVYVYAGHEMSRCMGDIVNLWFGCSQAVFDVIRSQVCTSITAFTIEERDVTTNVEACA